MLPRSMCMWATCTDHATKAMLAYNRQGLTPVNSAVTCDAHLGPTIINLLQDYRYVEVNRI